jgi:hypothetical protein
LHLRDTPFLQEAPAVPEGVDRVRLAAPRAPGVPSLLEDATTPHIASPEVVADEATQTLRLYYHGLDGFGVQRTRVAVSSDGLHFEAREEVLAPPCRRVFRYDGWGYGLAMPGYFVRSRDGLNDFEQGPRCFEPDMRHAALWRRRDRLSVFWTRVGDAPERILVSDQDLDRDWVHWRDARACEVYRLERIWEGASLPGVVLTWPARVVHSALHAVRA